MRKFQVSPPMTQKQYEALEESILLQGILNPIWLDEQGEILDGYYRLQIAKKHSITNYTTNVVTLKNDQEKMAAAYALQYLSHTSKLPTKADRVKAATNFYLSCPALIRNTCSTVARIVGLDRSTISKLRTKLILSNRILSAESRKERDAKDVRLQIKRAFCYRDKSQKAVDKAFVCRTANEQKTLLQNQVILGDEIKPTRHPASVNWQVKAFKLKQKAEKLIRLAKGKPLPKNTDIRLCDFRQLRIEPGSIDLICTDIDWRKANHEDWEELGNLAFVWLKPNGVFATIAGQQNLPLILATFYKTPLTFQHMFYYRFKEGTASKNTRNNVRETWRPILAYSKKENHQFNGIADEFKTDGIDKTYHEFQQPLWVVQQMVNYLCPRYNLDKKVLDPQMGSGTTGVACSNLGIPFIGCDRDLKAYNITRARLVHEGGFKQEVVDRFKDKRKRNLKLNGLTYHLDKLQENEIKNLVQSWELKPL